MKIHTDIANYREFILIFTQVAGTLEQLLGGYELYHYHSKLMMKEVKK